MAYFGPYEIAPANFFADTQSNRKKTSAYVGRSVATSKWKDRFGSDGLSGNDGTHRSHLSRPTISSISRLMPKCDSSSTTRFMWPTESQPGMSSNDIGSEIAKLAFSRMALRKASATASGMIICALQRLMGPSPSPRFTRMSSRFGSNLHSQPRTIALCAADFPERASSVNPKTYIKIITYSSSRFRLAVALSKTRDRLLTGKFRMALK